MIEEDGIIRSAADAERVARAAQALVTLLCADDRVLACYLHWRLTSGRLADLIAACDQLIHRDLRLPYVGLSRLVARQFAELQFALHRGVPFGRAILRIQPGEAMRQLPPGRAAKTTEDHVTRDVTWFYRHRIKQPPDSIRLLARTYRQSVDHPIREPRPLVQAGITRAERLLAALIVE